MKRASVIHSMRATAIVLSILVGSGSLCSMAHAQAWLPDRAYSEGPGIKAGRLEIHPGIAVRAGWDSNVFRTDGSAAYPRVDSGLVLVTPHLHVSTEGKQRATEGEDKGGAAPTIAFDAGVSATYFQYLKSSVQPDGVNIGVDTDALLTILPFRPINVELSASYQRSVQPFTVQVRDDRNYANSTVVPGVRVNMGSRSRVFNTYVGYAPRLSIYERNTDFGYLNHAFHSVQGGASWRFLPYTALLHDADLGLQEFMDDNPNAEPEAATLVSDSRRFVTRAGMNGALTSRLSLRAMIGYALMVFDSDVFSEYENAVGEGVLSLRFAGASTFSVGYQGNVTPSPVGGWMRTDRGFAQLRLQLLGALAIGCEAGAGYATYGRALRPGAAGTAVPLGTGSDPTEREDVRIDGSVRAEYRVTNWLAFMTDFSVLTTLTDFRYDRDAIMPIAGMPAAAPPLPAEFVTFQVYGGVRAFY